MFEEFVNNKDLGSVWLLRIFTVLLEILVYLRGCNVNSA